MHILTKEQMVLKLLQDIEENRQALHQITMDQELHSYDVISFSQKLDRLLNEYDYLLKTRSSKTLA